MQGGPVPSIVWRIVRWGVVAALLFVAYLFADRVWDASTVLRDDLLAGEGPSAATATVVAVGDGEVVLERNAASQAAGVWGITTPSGYALAGAVRDIDGDRVTRAVTMIEGTLVPGDVALVDAAGAGVPADPLQRVVVTGDLGIYPAWLAPGESDMWVIFVHDRGAHPEREARRILPSLRAPGHPVLMMSYRDDGVGPFSDGLAAWGLDEWRDLEAAARYAVQKGADRFVVVGYGMGATIAALFLAESPLAERVAGVVFDSAVLDVGGTAGRILEEDGLAGFLIGPARAVASLRFDVHWSRLDLRERAASFPVPLLLLHGTADRTAPIATTDAFAAAADAVYARFAGAGHAALWNTDPDRYERTVGDFLTAVTAPAPAG